MDLLERYLQAVGQYLPIGSREDTLAELRENLLAEFDARVEELGRPLTEVEVAAILQAHGRPVLVAAPYLPQRHLIGPAVFPFYLMTLRKVAPYVVLVYFIAQASTFLFALKVSDLGAAVGRLFFQLVPTMLFFWAIVTLVFAIIDFAHAQNGSESGWMRWNPADLPPVARQRKGKSLASRVADLVFHCLWMLYVLAIPSHPYLILGPGGGFLAMLSVEFAPIWRTFYAALIVLLVIQLGIKVAVLAQGTDSWKGPLDLVSKLFGVLVTAWLASNDIFLVPASPAAHLPTLAAVNHWMRIGFRVAVFFAVVDLAVEAWKYVRRAVPSQPLAF